MKSLVWLGGESNPGPPRHGANALQWGYRCWFNAIQNYILFVILVNIFFKTFQVTLDGVCLSQIIYWYYTSQGNIITLKITYPLQVVHLTRELELSIYKSPGWSTGIHIVCGFVKPAIQTRHLTLISQSTRNNSLSYNRFCCCYQLINNLSTLRTSFVEIHFRIINISRKYYLDSDDHFHSKLAGPAAV